MVFAHDACAVASVTERIIFVGDSSHRARVTDIIGGGEPGGVEWRAVVRVRTYAIPWISSFVIGVGSEGSVAVVRSCKNRVAGRMNAIVQPQGLRCPGVGNGLNRLSVNAIKRLDLGNTSISVIADLEIAAARLGNFRCFSAACASGHNRGHLTVRVDYLDRLTGAKYH